jgi:hypothetical protein
MPHLIIDCRLYGLINPYNYGSINSMIRQRLRYLTSPLCLLNFARFTPSQAVDPMNCTRTVLRASRVYRNQLCKADTFPHASHACFSYDYSRDPHRIICKASTAPPVPNHLPGMRESRAQSSCAAVLECPPEVMLTQRRQLAIRI